MKIGEVAQQVDVSPSTIRYYEGSGILPRPERDCRGYRDYNDADLDRIRLVTGARQLRISMEDIRQIVAMHIRGETPSPRILELLRQKAAEVHERNLRLESIKQELSQLREAALDMEDRNGAGARRTNEGYLAKLTPTNSTES